VFCDTDSQTYTIDPWQMESKITSQTVGVIPVHLYGQPCDMDAIMKISDKHGLWVLEDCAQAHLAKFKNRTVGTFGDAGTFSFYPGKNLGAMGDAGAIVTGDRDLRDRIAKFARHGGLHKGSHEIEGINSRLDGMQAAILSVRLKWLAQWTSNRQAIAANYNMLLEGKKNLVIPKCAPDRSHVYHLYVVQSDMRDKLAAHLRKDGIQTVINYPIALPFLPAYRRLGHRPEDFPNAFSNQNKVLSLPIFAEMSVVQQEMVVGSLLSFDG
jgi:dTDP-4-amino-4,6-dideoxygalactose transaminase